MKQVISKLLLPVGLPSWWWRQEPRNFISRVKNAMRNVNSEEQYAVRFQAQRRTISWGGGSSKLASRFYLPFLYLVELHTSLFHLVLCRCSLHQGAGGEPQKNILSQEKIQLTLACRNAPGAGFVPLLPCNHVEFIPFFHTAFWVSWIINTGTF